MSNENLAISTAEGASPSSHNWKTNVEQHVKSVKNVTGTAKGLVKDKTTLPGMSFSLQGLKKQHNDLDLRCACMLFCYPSSQDHILMYPKN